MIQDEDQSQEYYFSLRRQHGHHCVLQAARGLAVRSLRALRERPARYGRVGSIQLLVEFAQINHT